MSYEVKGTGTPIVFLPGLFAGGWIWDSVAKEVLAKGFRVFTFKDAIPVAFGSSYQKAMKELDAIIAESHEIPY